ncbi:NAD-dependent epimerase/dehydratase family protein [Kitasatospora sp. NPDC049285]|uniref:NAD-dependent epimerase/dehydratase family protein n=1 Tax=Kitasatospora sp. NPDC049285 TaxID=3157096 RepID=UPI0034375F34
MHVCVIGGSRYFGRLLISHLLDAGATVTVLNRGSVPPPPGVTHLLADRDDETALRAALAGRHFDVVIDQVCYTPRQAALATRVFADHTDRYVMTSTVEVYADLGRPGGPLLPESALDLTSHPIDLELPWHEPQFLESHYGEGKRQAEAVLLRDAAFPVATVRTAHVLGGTDFTGRLAHYLDRITAGRPVTVHPDPQAASFVHAPDIARFLAWTSTATFTGPINASSQGTLTAAELSTLIADITGSPTPTLHPTSTSTATATATATTEPPSPFSFDRAYPMDTRRARDLGFTFAPLTTWLPQTIRESTQR